MIKKLKQKKGFTLIEMIACVITLMLIAMIVSTGMDIAMKSMADSMFESNSQMFESTMNTYIGDILRHATVEKGQGESEIGDVTITNDAYYIDQGIFVIDTSESGIENAGYLVCTSKLDEDGYVGTMVANKGVYAGNLFIKDFELTYDSSKHIFHGSYVIVSSATSKTKTCEFSFRSIADMNVTE